jgi:hypothetical protein
MTRAVDPAVALPFEHDLGMLRGCFPLASLALLSGSNIARTDAEPSGGRNLVQAISVRSLRPVDSNGANERLAALVHMNMLNPHVLRAAVP